MKVLQGVYSAAVAGLHHPQDGGWCMAHGACSTGVEREGPHARAHANNGGQMQRRRFQMPITMDAPPGLGACTPPRCMHHLTLSLNALHPAWPGACE
jgi:hypothetical protein